MPVNAKFGIDLSVNDKSAKGVKSAEANFNRLGKTAAKVNKGSLSGIAESVGVGVRSAADNIGGVANKAVAHLGRIADAGGAGSSALKTLSVAGQAAQTSLEGLASVGGPLVATVLGLGLAATKFASSWASGGAMIARTSASIGVAAGDLQKIQGAFEQYGVTKSDTTSALGGLASTLHEARYGRNNEALAAEDQLGLSVKTGANGNPDVLQFMKDLADKIAKQTDPMTQARIAQMFGVSAALPALRQGSKAITAGMVNVGQYGAVVSDASLPQATRMYGKGVQLGQRAERAAMLAGQAAAGPEEAGMDALLGQGGASRSVAGAARVVGGALTRAAGDAASALQGVARAGATFLDRIEHRGERSRQDQVSPKGARGVMQLMPGTARDVARSLGQPFDEDRFRNDAAYSRMLGGRYAQDQLRRFKGDETMAAAAYNAGPGAVETWAKRYGDPRRHQVTDEQFAAAIPYKETRDYVHRVTGPESAGARQTQPQQIHLKHEFIGLPRGTTVKTTRKGSNETSVGRASVGSTAPT